jgi:thiol:disulfide interchange protein/DsbC/DsbD-like thiol-disulfide interchange protein
MGFDGLVLKMFGRIVSALLVAGFGLSAPVLAANQVENEYTTATLTLEAPKAAPGSTVWAMLTLTPVEGWHTYWRNPGDSGIPTTIAWTLPAGFSAGEIEWPAPQRIPVGPLMNYGYHGAARLLVPVNVPATAKLGETVRLAAEAKWLVCDEVCVPEEAALDIALIVASAGDAAAAHDDRTARLFTAALNKVPVPAGVAARVAFDEKNFAVVIEDAAALGLPEAALNSAVYFPFDDGLIDYAAPQAVSVRNGALVIAAARGYQATPKSGDGVITINAGPNDVAAFAVKAPVDGPMPVVVASTRNPTAGGGSGGTTITLIAALGFAFLGGLILNLMPCVFPVLSLKALSVARQADAHPHEARRDGLLFAAGVILSFLTAAIVLVALREAGHAAGWGMQLQSPIVVTVLAYVLFLVGLNLSGFYTVGGGAMGIGQSLADRKDALGSFFTGVLAAVVAAPCTAPFMAGAVGFALTQSMAVALVTFFALGLGFALPFLLISVTPQIRHLLPKPGAWMERFKEFLAFPMYAAAAWLVWVLSQQTGSDGVIAALAGAVLLAFAIWLWRAGKGRTSKALGRGVAVLSLAAALALAGWQSRTPVAAPDQATETAAYQPYSQARLDRALQQGNGVFVNFTAAWCITCLVNERVALSSASVAETLRAKNIVYLKGDWTNQDPEITAMLQKFGRSGVPLYLYYAPGKGENPVILPQILTPAEVERVLNG